MKFGKIILYLISAVLIFTNVVFGAVAPVFYSLSPYGAGSSYDLKNGSPTLTISSGVATLTVAQSGNIGVGCDIDFGAGPTNVYIAPNRLGFDSGGTTELKTGDKIEGETSSATGIVRAIEITSGSWAGGDAAGYIYFSITSSTWQNNEQINRTKPSSSSNIATADDTLQGNLGNGNTQFVVKDADGSDASDVGSAQTVNYIYHEYSSLSGFEAGFTDSNHINNSDLTAAGVVAHACCYYDHDDQTADTVPATILYGTDGADNYLYIFTPIGNSESINNQRHDGKKNINKYIMTVSSASRPLREREGYSRVEGLQLESTYPTGTTQGIYVNSSRGGNKYYFNNIIENLTSDGSKDGINVDIIATSTYLHFYNNIVYSSSGRYGYSTNDADATVYLYNNTFHDFLTAGIRSSYGTQIIKNNIVQNCTVSYSGTFDSTSTHNVNENTVSEGAFGATHSTGTADGDLENHLVDSGATFQTDGVQVGCIVTETGTPVSSYVTEVNSETDLTLNDDIFPNGNENYIVYTNMYGSVTFEDEGNDDFHLGSADTIAKDKATDLSSDSNLPMWDDIDRDARGVTWDVGADEYVTAAPPGDYFPLVDGGPVGFSSTDGRLAR